MVPLEIIIFTLRKRLTNAFLVFSRFKVFYCIILLKMISAKEAAGDTSMLVTDVGEEMC